jgi:hypothetical protein
MGTALHLAEVHQDPPGPKRKRKGGGGNGSGFYEYAQRIYTDDRADTEARQLLLAVAYGVTAAPPGDGTAQWDLVRQALGESSQRRSYSRLADFIKKDVPRYVPPEYMPGYDDTMRRCQAPRLRPYRSRPWPGTTAQGVRDQEKRDAENFRNVRGVCGDPGQLRVVELLAGTGWRKTHYFCNRHEDHAMRVREQVRAGNEVAPKPIPNAGGLLPSYFDADWVKVYRQRRGDDWEPPVYGIRADDWPIPGKEPVAPRARLRLAALDGELLGPGAG